MKVSCDIIKDILPLYAENMVSEDTKGMVEEHLCECPDCTERLGNMRQAQKLPAVAAQTDTSSMKRVDGGGFYGAVGFDGIFRIVYVHEQAGISPPGGCRGGGGRNRGPGGGEVQQ